MTAEERASLIAEVQIIERKKALEEEQKQASELIHKATEQYVAATKDNPLAGKELKTK